MKLPPEGARWLVSLRWLACAAVFAATWLTSPALQILGRPGTALRRGLRDGGPITCCSTSPSATCRPAKEAWTGTFSCR